MGEAAALGGDLIFGNEGFIRRRLDGWGRRLRYVGSRGGELLIVGGEDIVLKWPEVVGFGSDPREFIEDRSLGWRVGLVVDRGGGIHLQSIITI